MTRLGLTTFSVVVSCVLANSLSAQAQTAPANKSDGEPLQALIDRHMAPVAGETPAICTDAEFLRRVSLDLIGTPPSIEVARAFLADQSPTKRETYIDQLLKSPHYARHMAESYDLMLMERRPNKSVTADEWHAYLYQSAMTNKPWNVLAREILIADGDKTAPRAAVRFYLDRAAEPYVLARDVGRIFFGRDMQCAQCHDHPLIDDYHQRDYHGLLAFMLPGYQLARKEGKVTKTYYAEKSGSDVSFTSVFIEGNHTTRARLIGDEPLVEPAFLPGDEYKVAPAANVISIPKFSRRAILAANTTSGRNDAFNRNIANRFWAHMTGRGLVHPVDLHHSANPPAHPELLNDLSRRFVASGFDVKAFLRAIALSATYQRSIDLPKNLTLASKNAATLLPQLKSQRAEFKRRADTVQVTFDNAAEVRDKVEAAFLPVLAEMSKARKAYSDVVAKVTAARKKLKPVQDKRASKEKTAGPILAAALAAGVAVKAVPTDKELATAFATIKKKSDALQAELIALRKAEAPLVQAVAAQAKALEKPKATIAATEVKLKPLREAVLTSEKTAVATRSGMVNSATALAKLDQQVEQFESLGAYHSLNDQLLAAQTIVKQQAQPLANLQKELATATAAFTKAQADQNQATAAMLTATSQLKSAVANRDTQQTAVTVISAAASSSRVAAEKLASDKTLAQTALLLSSRSKQAQQKFETAKSNLTAADVAAKQATATLVAKQQLLKQTAAKRVTLTTAATKMKAAVDAARATLLTVTPKLNESVDAITSSWSHDFTIADLKPLTPEQMCWSILNVSGVYGRTARAEAAVISKAKPLTDAIKANAAQMEARRVQQERATWKKLKASVATFSKVYGAGAGQPQGDFFATADQALFAGNGGTITTWIGPDGKNVAYRMNAEADTKKIAEDLYLSILTRFPTEAEVADVTSHLAGRTDKPIAIQELIWGLITSVEFRFNH